MTDTPPPGTPYEIPPGGSLGLLAYGYRGLQAWRDARGSEWRVTFTLPTTPEASPRAEPLQGDIVIVSGLPRSGTSMLMQMLVAAGVPAFSDATREADSSNPRGYYEHEKVKRLAHDASWVPEADGHAVKVVAPLLPSLPPGPRYRVVFVERQLDEVIRSQATMLARSGRAPAPELALRSAYARQLRAAHEWMHTHAQSLVLHYADILDEPLAAASQIREFLGSAVAAEQIAAVVDPALYRQRA